MGQIPPPGFTGAYSRLGPGHPCITGGITESELGPFWPAEHGLGSFTSHCCISSHIPGQGGKEGSLDLKAENAPCHLSICFKSCVTELYFRRSHCVISLVTDASHLNAFSLLLVYLLFYWHFLFRNRSTVIRLPLLLWRPLLINLSVLPIV